MSQVLKGIKAIKCNVQETFFATKIEASRKQELSLYSKYINIRNILAAIYSNSSVLISSLIFLFADKNSLELGNVFSTLAMLGYIFNFSILYSNYALEALYSIKVFDKRITEVIEGAFKKQKDYVNKGVVEATIIDDDYDIMNSWRSNKKQPKLEDLSSSRDEPPSVKLENVYSQWNMKEELDTGEDLEKESYADFERAVLDVSFEFKNAEKVALIGKVGSGKTSLLLTILKELCIVKGKIAVNSRDVVYAEQNPHIMTGTVRQNILFGQPYNPKWYKKVTEACCLDSDFK